MTEKRDSGTGLTARAVDDLVRLGKRHTDACRALAVGALAEAKALRAERDELKAEAERLRAAAGPRPGD